MTKQFCQDRLDYCRRKFKEWEAQNPPNGSKCKFPGQRDRYKQFKLHQDAIEMYEHRIRCNKSHSSRVAGEPCDWF